MKITCLFLLISFPYLLLAQGKIRLAGVVQDAESAAPMAFASVRIGSHNIGTLTNEAGRFLLFVPDVYKQDTLSISYLGYKPFRLPVEVAREQGVLQVALESVEMEIEEILVNPIETWDTVRRAVKRISLNYNPKLVRLEGFYREILEGEKDYLLAEGVLEIYKQPVFSKVIDKVYVLKGRRMNLPYYLQKDGQAYPLPSIQEGPVVGTLLDIVRGRETFLDKSYLQHYTFKLEEITYLNGRVLYVIGFVPTETDDPYAYYEGRLFIDRETLTFVQADYKLSALGRKAANTLSPDLEVLERLYQVNYQQHNDRWYLHTARVRNYYRHRFTGQELHSDIRLLINEIDLERTLPEAGRKPVEQDDSFLEVMGEFDPEFWESYNIILPEE